MFKVLGISTFDLVYVTNLVYIWYTYFFGGFSCDSNQFIWFITKVNRENIIVVLKLYKKSLVISLNMVVPYFQDHKAQYQKLNASCSFYIHKAHRIIRRINEAKLRQVNLYSTLSQ